MRPLSARSLTLLTIGLSLACLLSHGVLADPVLTDLPNPQNEVPSHELPGIAFLFDACDLPACAPAQLGGNGDHLVLRGSPREVVGNTAGIASVAAIANAIRANDAHLDAGVHSARFPARALRGNVVPEPTTAVLLGLGLIMIGARKKDMRGELSPGRPRSKT